MMKGWDWGLGRCPLKDTVAVWLGGRGKTNRKVTCRGDETRTGRHDEGRKVTCQGDEARMVRHDEGLGLGVRPLSTEGHGCSLVGRQEPEARWVWDVDVSRGQSSNRQT